MRINVEIDELSLEKGEKDQVDVASLPRHVKEELVLEHQKFITKSFYHNSIEAAFVAFFRAAFLEASSFPKSN